MRRNLVSLVIIVAVTAITVSGCAATAGKVSQTEPVTEINLSEKTAVKGYDPVAYFTSGAPQIGQDRFTHRWQGATWRFASAENREQFVKSPEKYAPQYGGYCAFAMSRGYIADITPTAWAIVDGKLYLNNNAFAHQLWKEDPPGNISAANQNWPLIPKIKIAGQ